MFAIGNEELAKLKEVGNTTTAICPNCGKRHKIGWAKDEEGREFKDMGGVTCSNGSSYLVVVGGRFLDQEKK